MKEIERAEVLHDLIASMVGLYSIVEDGDSTEKSRISMVSSSEL